MKSNSDNFRNSAIKDVMEALIKLGINVIVYEPLNNHILKNSGYHVISDFSVFLQKSDIIIANRVAECLSSVIDKVYTRDIFSRTKLASRVFVYIKTISYQFIKVFFVRNSG